jgi:hypothetical protein
MIHIFKTREEMVCFYIPANSVIGEIGVFKGDFSRFLHSINPSKLFLIDYFQGITASGNQDGNNVQWTNMEDEYRNLLSWAATEQNIFLDKGDSSSVLYNYPDEFFDMLYLDGDHSYDGVKKDLEQAIRKVKKGGWIMGHDYEMNMEKAQNVYKFGVKQAVDEFCKKYNQTITAKANDGCVSYGICISNTQYI